MRRMTRMLVSAAAALAVVAMFPAAGRAEEARGGSGHGSGHEGMESHGGSGHGSDDLQQGALVRESKVGGYTFAYRLYGWAERNAMMKGMEGHQMHGMDSSGASTHHLMLFVTGADGKKVEHGKVGFVVVAPDTSEFKTLTMGMYDGYGADVPLKAAGVHTIRTKAVFGERTLTDEFTHAVK